MPEVPVLLTASTQQGTLSGGLTAELLEEMDSPL
jgi:hypothetical protein